MCCSSFHHSHSHGHAVDAEVYPDDPADSCACPGELGMDCCGARTGDDGLCERCRTHCTADHGAHATGEAALAGDAR